MPLTQRERNRYRRWLLIAWIVAFTALTFYAIAQNRQRITDIQQSRIVSCRQTYEAVREVFRPFFPPAPRTKKQQRDLDKFNRTVDRFKAKCTNQVHSKGAP